MAGWRRRVWCALLVWAAVCGLAPRGYGKPVTISYMGWGNPQEVDISKALLKAFQQKHPDIRVRYIHAPQFEDKLKTMMAGDIPPDVFYMPVDSMRIYVENGTLLPLDDYIRASNINVNDFFPKVYNAFRWNGRQYGIPKDFTTEVLYYNKDLFDKDGVPYPNRNWTWDDMLNAARKLTHDFNGDKRIDQFGLQFRTGTDAYYPWIVAAGGDILSKDGQRFVLNNERGREAVRFLHALNFKHNVALSNQTGAGRDAQAEFSNGKLAMYVGYGRWLVPRFREMNKFRWDCEEMPVGRQRGNIIITVAYSISSKSKHPREAFELVKFLTGPEGQALNSRLGLAIPSIKSVAYSDAFIDPEGRVNDRAFLNAVDYARVMSRGPNPEEFNTIMDPIWEQSLTLNTLSPDKALARAEPEINEYLARYRTVQAYPPVPWGRVYAVLAAALLAAVAAIVIHLRRAGPMGRLARSEERVGLLFISPWILGMLFFSLFPIVVSIILSFCRWTALSPLSQAQWAGLDNYARAFTAEPRFWQALKVTAIYSIFSVPLGLTASVGIAILLNQKVRGIPVFRTLYYLPSLVGGVSVAVLWWRIFNKDFGALNYALTRLRVWDTFGLEPINWLGNETWALPALILMSMWGVGGGMLIYLAALQGIPTQLYEAASIDGAGKARQFWTITLPMLSPVIFFNLIMGIIGSFQVFTHAYVMTGGGPNQATLFYVLYLFQKGFQQFQMGYASALAWILFAIVLVLTAFVMRTSKSWVHYEGARE